MRFLRLVPDDTRIDFVRHRFIAFAVTGLLLVLTVAALAARGLNLGVDFAGGTLIEARAEHALDLGELRARIGALGLGDFELQQYGDDNGLLIRVEQLPERAGAAVAASVRGALGEGFEFVRVETVGPRVGSELLRDGMLATLFAIVAIALYVATRFEWQFGLAAIVAIFHDVITTVGLFSALQLEFSLSSVAALLLLAGYSVNDTIVVFDRIRETLRKRKTGDLPAIINDSVNRTLSRTIMTSGTTLLAILPLIAFGGSALYGFSLALAWGIVVGTYSSIFVAAPLLLYLPSVARAPAPAPGPEAAMPDGTRTRTTRAQDIAAIKPGGTPAVT